MLAEPVQANKLRESTRRETHRIALKALPTSTYQLVQSSSQETPPSSLNLRCFVHTQIKLFLPLDNIFEVSVARLLAEEITQQP